MENSIEVCRSEFLRCIGTDLNIEVKEMSSTHCIQKISTVDCVSYIVTNKVNGVIATKYYKGSIK